jgi:hypothetical protein
MQIISSSTSRTYSNFGSSETRCMDTEEEFGSMALSLLAYTKTCVVYIPSACLY